MRTIDKLVKLANVRTSPYMSFNTITGTEVFVHVSTDELRMLTSIARAAHGSAACNNASVAIKEAVMEAEKAGMFGGGR